MPPVLLLRPGHGPDFMATSIVGGMTHNDLAAHYLLQSVIIPLLSHCTPKVRPLVISCFIYISRLIATTCCFYKIHCKPSWECVFKIPVDIDISLYHGKSSINYSKIENLVISTNLAINQLYIPWNHSCSWDWSPFSYGFSGGFPLIFPWEFLGLPWSEESLEGFLEVVKEIWRKTWTEAMDDPLTDRCFFGTLW